MHCAKLKISNVCEICGKCFSKPALLRRHLVVHSQEKSFICDRCHSHFSQKSSLQRHVRMKHAVAAECNDSDVAEHALAALKLLQASHTTEENTNESRKSIETVFQQPEVQQTLEEEAYSNVIELKDKLNPNGVVHLLTTQCILRQRPNRWYYVCEYCAKEFSKSYDLIRHRRSHTKETPYLCSRCLKRFATLNKLNVHQRLVHAGMNKYACSECSTSFSFKKQLYAHQSEKHSNFLYSCEHCKRNFRTNSAYEAHKKLETDPVKAKLMKMLPQPVIWKHNYKCIYCKKVFKRKFNCRIHMLIHFRRLVEKEHIKHGCLQCGKYFKKPSDLARHLLTHSKLKQHICQVCGKHFSLKSTLSRHLKTHQEQRSTFNCQVCGKCYATKASLQLHLRLHTGERPFKCEVCGETFRTSGHRLEHMRAERHKNISANALLL